MISMYKTMELLQALLQGPLASVFIVELENTLVPRLHQHVKKWRRYVDDIFAYVKNESTNYILIKLDSFHPAIIFTYEK